MKPAKVSSKAMTLDQAPDVLKLKEVGLLLRIGKNQVTSAVRSGAIPVVTIGRSKRVLKSSLVAFLGGSG